MYGNNKAFQGNKNSLIDCQKDRYSGFDPIMTNGDTMSILTIKRAYLKMIEIDDSIDWEELTDELANTLAQVMGDNEFCEWLDRKSEE